MNATSEQLDEFDKFMEYWECAMDLVPLGEVTQ